MRTDPNEVKSSPGQVLIKYLAGIMAVLYIFGGTAILLKHQNFTILGPYARAFGIVLIIYGVFRGYRVYKLYFQHAE